MQPKVKTHLCTNFITNSFAYELANNRRYMNAHCRDMNMHILVLQIRVETRTRVLGLG